MSPTEQPFNALSREDLFQKINAISTAANEAGNVHDLLDASLKNTLQIFSAKRGSIFLVNAHNEDLTLQSAYGMKLDEQKNIVKKLGQGVVGRVAELKKPILVKDIANDDRFKNYRSRKSYQTPSFICSPLMIKDKLIGVINVSDKENGKNFTTDELLVLDFLSNQIALNYQRTQLNQKLKYVQQESEHLKETLGKTSEEANYLKKQIVVHERLASLGKLAGGIAHEFNNPLDGVMRYTNLCLEHLKEEDEILKEYLLEIRQGLKRMAQIVKSLLACARNSQPSLQKTNLNNCIQQVIKDFNPAIFQKNIKVTTELSPNLPEITDLGIERIISNLVSNAIDAIDQEGTIKIKTNLEDSFIKIMIEDNGEGIDKEVMEQIFEPFYTTKKIDQGCGLGLTIVSEIVKYYDGKIELESAPKQGTVFTIFLPIRTIA